MPPSPGAEDKPFVGAVVLALGCTLFLAWPHGGATAAEITPLDTPPLDPGRDMADDAAPPTAAAEAPVAAPMTGSLTGPDRTV